MPIPTSTSTALPVFPPGRIANAVAHQVTPPSAERIVLSFARMKNHLIWKILTQVSSVRSEGYDIHCKF